MIGTVSKPASSSPSRSAPIWPSIIADGATMSAPAFAWETAVSARTSRVASLSTSPFSSIPQWPWLVYSQRQTSVMTRMSGTFSLIPRIARWMIPSFAIAPEAISSFFSGIPKRRTAGIPSAFTRCVSRTR